MFRIVAFIFKLSNRFIFLLFLDKKVHVKLVRFSLEKRKGLHKSLLCLLPFYKKCIQVLNILKKYRYVYEYWIGIIKKSDISIAETADRSKVGPARSMFLVVNVLCKMFHQSYPAPNLKMVLRPLHMCNPIHYVDSLIN